jgi:hypothetical protein
MRVQGMPKLPALHAIVVKMSDEFITPFRQNVRPLGNLSFSQIGGEGLDSGHIA